MLFAFAVRERWCSLTTKPRQPRQWALQNTGKFFLIGILILYGVSYLTTNNTIFLFNSLFLAIAIYNVLYLRFTFPSMTITVRNPSELFANRDGSFEVHIENKARFLAAGPLSVTFYTDQEDLTFDAVVDRVSVGSPTLHAVHFTPTKRGRLKIIAVSLENGAPFGLFARRQRLELDQQLLVFPEILEKVPRLPHSEQPRSGLEPQQSEDFQYLSPYQPGDDIRMIHWRKSATTSAPIVRRDFQKKERVEPRIFLADACPHFEFAVKVMATWVVHDEGFDEWALYGNQGLKVPADQAQMLAFLAEVTPIHADQTGDLLQGSSRRILRASDIQPT